MPNFKTFVIINKKQKYQNSILSISNVLSTKSLAAILQALRSHMRTALQLTSLQRCMRIMQMVDVALHRVCVCISAVLQQQKTNATKRKKKYTRNVCQVQGQLQRRRRCRSHFWRSRWLYDCLPAWLRLCLCPSACIAQALRLCLRLTHTFSLADSALSLCACVCVCVCFCLRLLCAFNFQFTAVPKLYLKANFAVAVAVSLPALCSNSSSRRSWN